VAYFYSGAHTLATLQPVGKKFRRFKADDTLLEFLANL
jgi:hypothetical protein